MVAALRFFDELQVLVECLLGFPRGAVDALQAGVVLVAAPVRGGAAGQLEGRDVLGGRDVRSAAQVAPNPFAGTGIEVVVRGELVAPDFHDFGHVLGQARLVVDEFELVGLVGQLLAGLLFGLVDAPVEQLSVLDDLAHLLLQRRQILRGERLGHLEVVVEAVGDGRPDPEFGVREKVLDGLGQDVRGRMPDDTATVVGVGRHRRDLGVGVGHPTQVAQFSVGVAHHHDRVGRAPPRQSRLPHSRRRGRPGRNPNRGCGGGVCGGAHRVGSPGVCCA